MRLGAAQMSSTTVDIGAVEQVDADEAGPAAEALGDQAAPVAFVAIRN